MKKNITAALLGWLAIFLGSCGSENQSVDKKDPTPINLTDTATDKMVQTEIDFDASSLLKHENSIIANFPKSNNAIAFDIYQKLAIGDDNVTFSPLSVSAALAMAYAGSKSETEEAFKATLHFGDNTSDFHKAYGDFTLLLANKDRSESETTFKIANTLWLQKDFLVLDTFKNTLVEAYKALPVQLDFKNQPGPSTAIINQTISKQTQGEIDPLLKQDLAVDSLLVLTNALYFQSKWRSPFEKESTDPGTFMLKDGSPKAVQFMSQVDDFPYGEDEQKQFLLMPYEDSDFATLIVLPKTGQLASVQNSLNADSFARILDRLSSSKIDLRLPKFSQRTSPDIKGILAELGLGIAFDRSMANFQGISDTRLFISDIIHEAVVKMHEGGTTASAATAVVYGEAGAAPGGSAPEKIINFYVTRSFLFYIIHRPSGAILFMGRINEPGNEDL